MSKLLLASVSLVALGVAIILFEELVANNRANLDTCPYWLTCTVIEAQDPVSIGIFPAVAGAIMFGLHKMLKSKESKTRSVIS